MTAAQTFMSWTAEEWSAAGTVTVAILSAPLAFYAGRQLQHSRQVREDQARPYVVVDVTWREILAIFRVRNLGQTAATDVRVRLTGELRSVSFGRPAWQDGPLFTTGVPMLAPGQEMRFFIDSMPARLDSDLPTRIDGFVEYRGLRDNRGRSKPEAFVIDLGAFEKMALPDKGMHELIGEVEKLRKEAAKWTDSGSGSRGLLVYALDRRRNTVRSERSYHIAKAAERREAAGWRAAFTYYVALWRRRRGW